MTTPTARDLGWWARRKLRRSCLHHDIGGNPANTRPAISYIKQELVDLGRRKRLWCGVCGKVWIV